MNTYALKASDIKKEWHIVDATDLVVGRAAAVIASYLRGKHKPEYSPHLDCGDNIIVINAEKVKFTGNKFSKDGKIYYWHTGYMGGIKETSAKRIIEGKHPERVLENAVKRMLSKNPMGRQHFRNLHIYTGSEHPHKGQQPKPLDLAKMNNKNKIKG
jgi:large subunit ribosomal protein L13